MPGTLTRLRSPLASTMAELDKSALRWLLIATTVLVVAIIASVTTLTVLNKNTAAIIGLIPVLIVPFVGAVLYSTHSKLDRVESKVDGVDVKVNGNVTKMLNMISEFGTSPTVTIPVPHEESTEESEHSGQ